MDIEKPGIRERKTSLEDLQRLAESGNLYAVVDSCNVPLIAKKVLELGEERVVCLYRGTSQEELWGVAPYLVKLDQALLSWLRVNASHEGWGILTASKSDLGTLRHHFRHFLRVQEPQGNIWNFRFYDPRVLEPFLPSCSQAELNNFFGPALAYGIAKPGISGATFLQLSQPASGDLSAPARYAILFRLRSQHIEALKPQVRRAFAFEVVKFLEKKFPQFVQGLPGTVLEKRVLAGLKRAEGYGFGRNSTLAAFVGIMLDLGPRFDEQPAIRATLRDRSVPQEDRWNLLFTRVSDEDWEQAGRLSGPKAWDELTGGPD